MPPQGGSTLELFADVLSASDTLMLGLVLALLVLIVLECRPAPPTRDPRPDRSPVAALHVRRAWQTSGRRRRVRMAGYTGVRPTVAASVGSVWVGGPSPAMRRLRARTVFRHLSRRDLAVARYPY